MTFLDKYELLKKSIPVPAVAVGLYTQDCSYVDYVYSSKNCHYCFGSVWLVDGLYCYMCWGNKLVDCHAVTQSQLCYECIDCNNCYNATYLLNCNGSKDCHFSAFLDSCSDCFGCVALTHKKYCIFNKQYTKEEYDKKIKELKKESPQKILKAMLGLKKKIPHPASQQFNNENCPYGDYVYGSKNCYWCFHTYFAQDSGYSFTAGIMNNCWDIFFSGGNSSGEKTQGAKGKIERCYEAFDTDVSYNCAFVKGCSNCTDCFYSSDLRNCSDCFGCVGLSNKKYCILNNQLTKDQYENGIAQIKKELGWKVH